jgi:hypothetical protein
MIIKQSDDEKHKEIKLMIRERKRWWGDDENIKKANGW